MVGTARRVGVDAPWACAVETTASESQRAALGHGKSSTATLVHCTSITESVWPVTLSSCSPLDSAAGDDTTRTSTPGSLELPQALTSTSVEKPREQTARRATRRTG